MTDRPRGFTLVRTFAASPDRVFRAWTDSAHLDWFFNDTMTTDVPTEVDLRVGGAWRQMMVIDDDTAYVTGGIYREIVPGKRLVLAWGAVGGWPDIDPDDLDAGPTVTITFHAVGGGTRMTLRLDLPAGISDAEARDWFAMGIEPGMTQTIDRFVPAP
jgi:uncharacterized protein YndB with AHSA1/START domain